MNSIKNQTIDSFYIPSCQGYTNVKIALKKTIIPMIFKDKTLLLTCFSIKQIVLLDESLTKHIIFTLLI